MSTALQHPTSVSAVEDNQAAGAGQQTPFRSRERIHPDHKPVVPDGRLHHGRDAATVSMMLARVADANLVHFGGHLQAICEDLATACHRPRGPTLTWSASETDIPSNVAATFGLVADLLITQIYVYAFPPGRGGRIDASFTVDDDIWALTIDDSGIPIQPPVDRRRNGLTIARQAVRHHAGWIDMPRMGAGTRQVVTIPRSMRASFLHSVPAVPATSVPSWPGRTNLIEAVAQVRLAIPTPVPSTPPNATPTALGDAAAADANDDGVTADAAGR
jgi:hypothetical protein